MGRSVSELRSRPLAARPKNRPVTTPVRTVDGLCNHMGLGRVDFIKADVEGAEAAVLSGARRTLLRHRPALLLEIEDRHLEKYDTKCCLRDRRLPQLPLLGSLDRIQLKDPTHSWAPPLSSPMTSRRAREA